MTTIAIFKQSFLHSWISLFLCIPCLVGGFLATNPLAAQSNEETTTSQESQTNEATPPKEEEAQTNKETLWQQEARERFESIYVRGDFRGRNPNAQWLNDSSAILYQRVDPTTNQSASWYLNAQTGEHRVAKPEEVVAPEADPMLSPNKKYKIKLADRNIVLANNETNKEQVVAESPNDRDVHYRQFTWSPDGNRCAFIEVDVTDVALRNVLVPGDPTYPGVAQNRFARVGETIESLRVGVVDTQSTQAEWLPIKPLEGGEYFGQIDWTADSQEVLVEQFSRFRNLRNIILSAPGKDPNIVYSETDNAWVESSQGKNSGIIWTNGGKSFILISEKDEWRQAYHYAISGKELSKLTEGEYDIIDRAVVDEAGGWFYFYASPADATQKYLYRVPLTGPSELQRITPENQIGTHTYQFSPDAKFAVHTFSTINSPPITEVVEIETHRSIHVLEDNLGIQERMKGLQVSPVDFLKLDIGNGINLDAWMVKPKNFNPSRKYPLFIYVYGEPHAQTVLNEWGAAQIDFHRVVAELGYVVVSIDNRGTPAPKGAAWRRSVYPSLGPLSTEEQEAGLQALIRKFRFIDRSRVGIWGWSGGGTNTLNALFRKPDSYHVGIAVVPKPKPHLYNAWFQEIYMRTPAVNTGGYEKASAFSQANGLRGKLLIITGSGETNTHIQIIESLVDELIRLGKSFDYMVYPNRDHALREGDGTLVHVRMLITRYLIENLPRGPR